MKLYYTMLVAALLGYNNLSYGSGFNESFDYSEVVKVDSTINQKQLYNKALEWITLNFKSANDVIQLKNENTGSIIVKGNFVVRATGSGLSGTIHKSASGHASFILEMKFKDGRYKYHMHSFVHKGLKTSGGALSNPKPAKFTVSKSSWGTIKTMVRKDAFRMMNDIYNYVKVPDSASEEDW